MLTWRTVHSSQNLKQTFLLKQQLMQLSSILRIELYVLARDAFIEWIFALLPWCSSVRLSVCPSVWDERVLWSYGALLRGFKFTVVESMYWAHWQQSMSTYSQLYVSSSTWKRGGIRMCELGLHANTNTDKISIVRKWIQWRRWM